MRKIGRKYIVKVTTGERITVPAEFRRKLGIRAGDKVRFTEVDGGFRIEAARKRRVRAE